MKKSKSRRRSAAAITARRVRAGSPPGSALFAGTPRDGQATVHTIAYGPDSLTERSDAIGGSPVVWRDLVGVHDAAAVQALCEQHGVHPLAMEDVLNPAGRARTEAYDGSTLVTMRALDVVEEPGADTVVRGEQIAFVLGDGWLLSFQERAGDVFDPVRHRLRAAAGRIRSRGADYLLHALLDCAVDRMFVALEVLEDRTDRLEGRAVDLTGSREFPAEVHALRDELQSIRRALWPLREITAGLHRNDTDLIGEATLPYFRDLHDHVVQALDIIDSARERLVGLLELHLALVSHRTNEVMRTLTVVATIFIPLTFLAGIYGMNFEWMPELAWPWAYPTLLAVMAGIGGATLWGMKRRGLLG